MDGVSATGGAGGGGEGGGLGGLGGGLGGVDQEGRSERAASVSADTGQPQPLK